VIGLLVKTHPREIQADTQLRELVECNGQTNQLRIFDENDSKKSSKFLGLLNNQNEVFTHGARLID
jgi:hypothetical protein